MKQANVTHSDNKDGYMKWSYGFLLTLRELGLKQSIVDVKFDYETEQLWYVVQFGDACEHYVKKISTGDRACVNVLERYRLSRTIIQLPVLYDNTEYALASLLAERDTESKIAYYNLGRGGNLSYIHCDGDIVRTTLDLNEPCNNYDLLLTSKAVREGFGFVEAPGSHMIIIEPSGKHYKATWWDCDCEEFAAHKDCLHKRMVHVYSNNRIEFQGITAWMKQ